MCVDLKRFSGVRFRSKLDTAVEVPLDLDLEHYCVNPSGESAHTYTHTHTHADTHSVSTSQPDNFSQVWIHIFPIPKVSVAFTAEL